MWTFLPILKSTIWGGDSIAPFKGIKTDKTAIGESWEISGVEGDESVVAAGPDKDMTLTALIDKYGEKLLGKKNFQRFGNRFPLLVKIIDAAQDLSVQVHPDDDMARRLGQANGKTEMWYVLKAKKDARLALGFTRAIGREEFRPLVESGEIENVLRFIPVRKGEAYFIPGRTVHAIGKGMMVAEIQQTSDVTYRLYDYRRKGPDGKERQLHIDLAEEASDLGFTDGTAQEYRPVADIPVCLASSPYFTTNVMHLDMEVMRDYREYDTFVILIATEGKAVVECGEEKVELSAGHSILIPASAMGVTISPDKRFSCLETYIK